MSINKNLVVFLFVFVIGSTVALVGAYNFGAEYSIMTDTIINGVFHLPEDIPQGPDSGLDADTLDGLQLEDIISAAAGPEMTKIGCDASNADPTGVNEYSVVCWNSNYDGHPLILACSFQQEHGSDASATADNKGGCVRITDTGVDADQWETERVFFKNKQHLKAATDETAWLGGDLHDCSISDADIGGGANEFGFACGGTEGILACTAQVYHDGRTGSLMCINRDWDMIMRVR